MAFASSIIQPVSKAPEKQVDHSHGAALLTMLLLSVYAAQKSRKSFRKMKRKFLWTAFKLKTKSFFKKADISDRTLIYILLGVAALVLIIVAPIAALVLAIVALILILAGVI